RGAGQRFARHANAAAAAMHAVVLAQPQPAPASGVGTRLLAGGIAHAEQAQVPVHVSGLWQGVYHQWTLVAAFPHPHGRKELPLSVSGLREPVLAAGQHDAALPHAPVAAQPPQPHNAQRVGVCGLRCWQRVQPVQAAGDTALAVGTGAMPGCRGAGVLPGIYINHTASHLHVHLAGRVRVQCADSQA
ncbi:hypothetical protein LPJ70_007074, partial [Coemansia sp. RSA 2708]